MNHSDTNNQNQAENQHRQQNFGEQNHHPLENGQNFFDRFEDVPKVEDDQQQSEDKEVVLHKSPNEQQTLQNKQIKQQENAHVQMQQQQETNHYEQQLRPQLNQQSPIDLDKNDQLPNNINQQTQPIKQNIIANQISQNLNVENEKPQQNVKVKETFEQPKKMIVQSQLKNQMIVHAAQNERLASTFALFAKYNTQYKKTVGSYKLVLKNVRSELINKQNQKKQLRSTLIQYFETDIALNKSFYEKSYKIQKEQQSTTSMNKLANIKQDLRQGFEGLFCVRKSLADQMRKLESYILTYTIKSLNEAFETYQRLMNSEERKQSQIVDQYFEAQKSLEKILATIQKLFKKGIKGERGKEDIFIWIVKFINQQKNYRQSLIKYGKTIIQLRKTYIIGQKQLFNQLQRIINQFKLQSRTVYASKKENFVAIENYLPQIEKLAAFQYLCTITDIDYIKSVLQLQNRKEYIKFTDQHFVNYLDLLFFDHIVGNKKDLFKGAINKCFALLKSNEQLVHTISGNLVQFNKETDECRQKLQIKNLNVRLIGEGAIQCDELIKGIVFSENRTLRFKLKDNDSAEELICYLNEKSEIQKK